MLSASRFFLLFFSLALYLHFPFEVAAFPKTQIDYEFFFLFFWWVEVNVFSCGFRELSFRPDNYDKLPVTALSISFRIIVTLTHTQFPAESLIKTELLLIMWNVIFLPIVIPVALPHTHCSVSVLCYTFLYCSCMAVAKSLQCQCTTSQCICTLAFHFSCKYHTYTKSDCNTCTFKRNHLSPYAHFYCCCDNVESCCCCYFSYVHLLFLIWDVAKVTTIPQNKQRIRKCFLVRDFYAEFIVKDWIWDTVFT